MKPGWRWAFIVAALGFGSLAVVLALPFHRAGLKWLVQQAQDLSGGRLQVSGLSGDIRGPLRLESLTLALPDKRIRLQGLSLDWRLGELWERSLHVTRVHIARLEIDQLKPRNKPLQAPHSLLLPVSLRMDEANLDTLVLSRPGSTQTYTDARARLADDGRYLLELQHLQSPWGTLAGHLRLEKRSPFLLAGQLSGARSVPVPLALQAEVAGSLLEPVFKALAGGGGLKLKAYLSLEPFTALRVQHLVIAAEGLNPRTLFANAP
ncbi:MAG TPA: hypothetical protein VEQ09_08865, partial [Aquabacterium sp.]|nr:hypothetical protein [Aquabacterium sp.]